MIKNMKVAILRLCLACSGVLIVAESRAQTTVVMTCNNATSYAENSGDFVAYLNDAGSSYGGGQNYGQIIFNDDLIGIYGFSISAVNGPGSGLTAPSSFFSTCVSPTGLLYTGTPYTYNLNSFANDAAGNQPPAWANSGNNYWGIQNASYIFGQLAGKIDQGTLIAGQAGGLQDQGAAMALAMYSALYNSKGYGLNAGIYVNPATSGYFTLSALASASDQDGKNVYADYLDDLGILKAWNPIVNTLPAGSVLVPTTINSAEGQDMVLLGPAGQGGSSVPEPTTVIAGALLLLPFGASTIRIFRRKRAA